MQLKALWYDKHMLDIFTCYFKAYEISTLLENKYYMLIIPWNWSDIRAR